MIARSSIHYLCGISRERKLGGAVAHASGVAGFTGLSFDEKIPHHFTFSKNRGGRFRELKLLEQLFEQIVQQRVEVRLVQGTNLLISFVMKNGLVFRR